MQSGRFIRASLKGRPKVCIGCEARNYTIAILREQLHERNAELEVVHGEYAQLVESLNDKLDHALGVRRGNGAENEQREMKPIHRSSGIGDRLRKAENASKDPVKIEQRRKEYDERINKILGNEDAKVS